MYKFFSKGKLDLLRSHESLWMKRERKDNGGDKQLEGQLGLEERKTKGTERCEKGSQQKQVEGGVCAKVGNGQTSQLAKGEQEKHPKFTGNCKGSGILEGHSSHASNTV